MTKHLSIFGTFLLLGILKAWPALHSSDLTLFAPGGDGEGMLDDIYSIAQTIREHGPAALMKDTIVFEHELFGLRKPWPSNVLWKTYFYFLSLFLDPIQIYEFTAVFFIGLIGSLGVLIATELGITFPIALTFGAALFQLPHFPHRLEAHLFGLGTFVGPLILILGWIKAFQKRTPAAWAIAALCMVINFLSCEYYGYYGIWFSIALVLSDAWAFWGRHRFNTHAWKKQLLLYACSVTVFVSLMGLVYPTFVGAKLLQPFGSSLTHISKDERGYNIQEFYEHSFTRPWAVFQSGFSEVREFLRNSNYEGERGGHSIGLLFPLLGLLSGLVLLQKKKALPDLRPWVLAGIISVSLAASPKYFFALSEITFLVAPQFRVGARAYIFYNLTVLICVFLLLNAVWNSIKDRRASLAFGVFLFLGWVDMQGGSTFKPWNTHVPHEVEGYGMLNPPGLLLELPVFSIDQVEVHYRYRANRRIHGQDLVNGVYPGSDDKEVRRQLSHFFEEVKCLKPDLLMRMRRAGLSTLVVNSGYQCPFEWIKNEPLVQVLYQGPTRTIYVLEKLPGKRLDFKKDILNI